VKHRKFVALAVVAALAGAAFAHFVPLPLSYAAGPEILSEVVVYHSTPERGAPAYKLATEEGDEGFALEHGDSFWILDDVHSPERIVFDQAQFADIGAATDVEVVAAIGAQATRAVAFSDNGFIGLRGVVGGSSRSLRLEDGAGAPLESLHLDTSIVFGRDDIELHIATPAPEGLAGGTPSFAQHPYVVLGSNAPGLMRFHGQLLPVQRNASMATLFQASAQGLLPGFIGVLDEHSTSTATLPLDQIDALFGPNPPSDLFFVLAVLSLDGSQVELVSSQLHVSLL